jgi:hypothetical protein
MSDGCAGKIRVIIPEFVMKEMLGYRRQGWGWRRISTVTGYSMHTLRRRLREAGDPVQLPARIVWDNCLDAALLKGRRERVEWRVLEDRIGIGRGALRRRLVELQGLDSPLLGYASRGRRPKKAERVPV